jgi:membrane-bound serine protease (ClpP class)
VILLVGAALAIFVVPDGWGLPVVAAAILLEATETAIAIRISRRGAPKAGPETLIGMSGRAVTDCQPSGTVRVRGEDWRAHSDRGAAPGQRVRVLDRDGLTLRVEPID